MEVWTNSLSFKISSVDDESIELSSCLVAVLSSFLKSVLFSSSSFPTEFSPVADGLLKVVDVSP